MAESKTKTKITRKMMIKKRTKRFVRHQSDRFLRVKPSWRKPRGIDSRIRRRFRSSLHMPTIGFRNRKEVRHLLPNMKRLFVVNNVKEIEALLMNGEEYVVQIAHKVSARKRKIILAKAEELEITVMNAKARLTTEEVE